MLSFELLICSFLGTFSDPNLTFEMYLSGCSANVDFYKVLVKELAQTLEKQFSGNAESRAAGMVINTMGWIDGVGYDVQGSSS